MGVSYNFKGPKIITDGLITYFDSQNGFSYPYGETSNIKDLTKNRYTADIYNIDYSNDGLNFEGTDADSYIRVPSSSGIYNLEEYTYLAWIKTPVIQNTTVGYTDLYMIFSRWGSSSALIINVSLQINTGLKKLRANIGDGISQRPNTFSNTVLSDNTWYQVGVSYKAPFLKIIVNGEVDVSYDTGLSVGEIATNGADLFIGRFDFGWTLYKHHFKGKMDNIMIYNRELTDAEILHNFNEQKGRFGL